MAWNVSMCSWYVVYQLLDGDTSSWWNLASQNMPRSSDSTCSIEREEFLHKYETRKETYQIPCIWKPLQGPTTKSSVSSYERWFKETSALVPTFITQLVSDCQSQKSQASHWPFVTHAFSENGCSEGVEKNCDTKNRQVLFLPLVHRMPLSWIVNEFDPSWNMPQIISPELSLTRG